MIRAQQGAQSFDAAIKDTDMKRTLTWLPLMAGLLLFAMACKNKPAETSDALTLQNASLATNAFMNNDTAGLELSLTLAVEYPADYADQAILDKVRHQVIIDYFPEGADTTFADPDALLAAYVDDYKRFFFESESAYADVSGEEDYFDAEPWYNDQKLLVRYNEGDLFSYTVATDRYSGGAHGEKKFVNRVIDLKTGLKVTENELFTEEAKPMIVEMIQRQLLDEHGLKTVEELEEIGYFDVSEMNLNTNFFISKKGLTYTFNEYEIASYAVGASDVTLTFKSLAGFLKEGHPLNGLVE